jgi:DNA-binding transcriptional LysR family regulator
VFLTDAGRAFLEGARSVIVQSEQAAETARRVHLGKTGRVRVGIAWGLGETVSTVLNEYSRRRPEIEIEFRNISSGEQNEALRLRNIDVGFLRPPIDHIHNFSRALFQERFVAVVSNANPLSKFKSLKLEQLAKEPLLLIPRSISGFVFDKTLELYRDAGIRPRTIQTETLPYEEAGAILVASGRGIYIAVGQNPVHSSFLDRVKAIPLNEPEGRVEVHVIWRRQESSRPVLSLIETVDAMLSKRKQFYRKRSESRPRR